MPRLHLLVCDVAELHVGWPAAAVREVVRMVAVTPLPEAPPLVEGVVDLRGELVPVLALRARLGLPPREPSPEEHLVFLHRDRRDTVACRVDRAQDLVTVDETALTAPTGLAAAARGIAGVAATADGLIVVHDVDAFLSEAESLALADALAARTADRVTPA